MTGLKVFKNQGTRNSLQSCIQMNDSPQKMATGRKVLVADAAFFSSHLVIGQRQYALQFAKDGWNVAYITNPLSPFNTLFSKDKSQAIHGLVNHMRGGIYIKENLWYYVPFTFAPFHNYTVFDREWFLSNYYKFTVPSIRSVIKKRGFSKVAILWLGTPHQKFWKEIVDYEYLVYRLADNTREFITNSGTLLQAEKDVIQCADFILVTSKLLLEEYKSEFRNKKFIYCPNGVDLSNFVRKSYKKPADFNGIHGRIALYVGSIEEWFDKELLIQVAKLCPEITFFIVGKDPHGIMKRVFEGNIRYLGPKNYKDIPDYIHYSDCGIIPFKNTRLVQTVSPIKMYEFFSLGKPVVSRSWAELRLLNSPCFLAKDADEFADILKDSNTFAVDCSKLVGFAEKNTWRCRYLAIMEHLFPFCR